MFNRFKIVFAIVVAMVFVFRLLFINIGILASFNSQQTGKLIAKIYSENQKRRRNADVTAQSNAKDYTIAEICAEDSDNEEETAKANTPAVLTVLFSFLKYLVFIPKSNFHFDSIKCNLYPKKYLALSIIRV